MGHVQLGWEVGAAVAPGNRSDLLSDLRSGRYACPGRVVTFPSICVPVALFFREHVQDVDGTGAVRGQAVLKKQYRSYSLSRLVCGIPEAGFR